MKKVQLYINETKEKATIIASAIKVALEANGYTITNENPDIIIGFGGDGTLFNWLLSTKYSTNAKYIGINCGTLGFFQDFSVTNPEEFVINIPQYIEEKLNFVTLTLKIGEKTFTYQALNEFNLLNNDDNAFKAKIHIADSFLEDLTGDGLIFASPTGSTAHNISSGGSILYPGMEAIIMTPSGALVNSKSRCLPKGICIPKGVEISLTPLNHDSIKLLSDGNNLYTGKFDKIIISYSPSYIIKLTNTKNNFIEKVREKLIM